MPHSAFFSADYTLSVPSRRSSPTSSSGSYSEPVTPVGSTVDAPPPYLAEHQSSPYDSMRSSLAVATPHDDSPLGLIAKGHQLQADYFPTLLPHQSSVSSTSNEGRAHKSAYSPGSGKDRRKAPPPIAIASRRQLSTFSFPASPTENDVSPLTITIARRSPGPSTAALVNQFPAPPNLTPPLSPTHDVAPAVPRPRRQSTAPSSSRVSMRKSSLVDGQLISAPPYAPDFGSHSSSPAFDKASVGSAPAAPRRMSIVGSGTRRRSSTGHGHPGSTGYASFSSCINGASPAFTLSQWLQTLTPSLPVSLIPHQVRSPTRRRLPPTRICLRVLTRKLCTTTTGHLNCWSSHSSRSLETSKRRSTSASYPCF